MSLTRPAVKISSREELSKLRQVFRGHTLMRLVSEEPEKRTEVHVSMADCGIKAGARDTLLALVDEVAASGLEHVAIMAVDCAGSCETEPVIEVKAPGQNSVRYKNVDVATAREIVKQHLLGGSIVERAKM